MFNFNNEDNDYNEYENSNLQIKYNNICSKYENAKEQKKYAEDEYKKLKSMVENLCKSTLSNEYNYNQLGGNSILKGMDIYKLIEFTNMDIQKQKIEQLNLIKKLNDQIIMQQQIINTLKEQLTQSMVFSNKDISEEDINNSNIINNTNNNEMNVFNESNFDMDSSIEDIKIPKKSSKIITDAFGNVIEKDLDKENNNSSNIKTENNKVHEEKLKDILGFGNNKKESTSNKQKNTLEQNNDNIIKNKSINTTTSSSNKENQENKKQATLTIENVDVYMESMTPLMWDILEVIGSTGCSTSNDIIDNLSKKNKDYENSKIKSSILNAISSLVKMAMLTQQSVSTGFKRFNISKLSNKGEIIYQKHFNNSPVESEIDKIIRDHDNIQHGYTIRETRDLLLSKWKCKSANMNRSEISIKLPNNHTYIPDIIAVHPKGYKMYVEVELGNTPQKDFNDKCNKMIEVTKHLYFVTDIESTISKKLEQQISTWILQSGGKDKVKGVTIYIATTTQLSKGDQQWNRVLKY